MKLTTRITATLGLALAPAWSASAAQDDIVSIGETNYWSSGTRIDGVTVSGPFLGCEDSTLAVWELRNEGTGAVGLRFDGSETHQVDPGGRIVAYNVLSQTDADGNPAVYFPIEINGVDAGLIATARAECYPVPAEQAIVEHDYPDTPLANFYNWNPPQCCGDESQALASPEGDDTTEPASGAGDDGAGAQQDGTASGPRIQTGTVEEEESSPWVPVGIAGLMLGVVVAAGVSIGARR